MNRNDDLRTVWWQDSAVYLIDQRLLPGQLVSVRCDTLEDVGRAIKSMQVRGAPAIGCTAAYGMALIAQHSHAATTADLCDELRAAKGYLDGQRPTAVNLQWATARMVRCAETAGNAPLDDTRAMLLDEAQRIHAEDLAMCYAIGEHGAPLIPERGNVLTHCNAGGLATAGYGTALAPIRTAHGGGRAIHVYVDETRPFLQGARLTAWELQQSHIPLTLITDNMAGYFMQQGAIDCVIVGADRVVANGDIANKIGTYSVAVLAHAHNIPFYVAAPSSTIDLSLATGATIPIEERSVEEVVNIGETRIAPEGVHAAHPAFDVTPARLITAIITERGVVYPPFEENLRKIVPDT